MSGGGGSGNTSTSSSTTAPPSYLQPYLKFGADQAKAIYQSPSGSYYPGQTVANPSTATQAGNQAAIARGLNGSPVVNSADQYTQGVLGGAYLGGNPYQGAVDQSIRDATIPAVNAQFSAGGRYGSGAHAGTMETALANAIAPQHYATYNAERNNQQQSASLAPTLGGADWQDIAGVQTAGQNQDTLAQNQINANKDRWDANQGEAAKKLADFMRMIQGGNTGGTTTGSQTNPDNTGMGIAQILAGLGGGLLSGLSL